MDVEFRSGNLDRLETDLKFHGGFSSEVVRAYRRRMQQIRAAVDERTFYALKSLHYEKLKGKRKHQRSIRLNNQWRLVIEVIKGNPKNTVRIVAIEDYH